MNTYELTATVTISISTNVEASSLDEAIQIANERQDIMNGEFEDPDINEHWVAHNYDGSPCNVREAL